MSLSDVINRFSLVSGLDPKEISMYLPMIVDAIAVFEEKTKGRELSALETRRLTHACAVYAYYKVSLCRNTEELSSFKAGDVSISVEIVRANALSMWEKERDELSDIISFSDSDFSFLGVSV